MMVKGGSKQIMAVPTMALARHESDQLVMSLLQRQERLEYAQARFMHFQAAINAFNLSKTHRLALSQKRLEGQIVAGRAALVALEHSLEKEATKVKELQEDVSIAEVELENVKSELKNLEKTIQQQSEQLSKQGNEIKKLSISKNQREALVEALILLTSLAAIRSSFVTLPLSTVLVAMPRGSRVTIATKTTIRFVLFVALLRRLRSYAVLSGWTSEEASMSDVLLNMVFQIKST